MLRPKWWLSLIYLIVVLYLMCVFQIYADTRQKYKPDGTLYSSTNVIADVVHDQFTYTHNTWICDAFVYPCLLATIVRLLLTRCPRQRRRRLSKFISVLATLYLIRCFTIIATIMPTPDRTCKLDHRLFGNWFYGALLILCGQAKTCSDEVFSGHTINIVTCLAVWVIYHRSALVYIVASIYGTIALLLITLTRYHYTIDVVVGLIIAVLLHLLCYKREIQEKFYPELRRSRIERRQQQESCVDQYGASVPTPGPNGRMPAARSCSPPTPPRIASQIGDPYPDSLRW